MSSSNQENQQNGAQQEMRTSLQGSQQNQNQFKQSSRTEGQISADEFDKVDSDRDKNAKVDNDLNKWSNGTTKTKALQESELLNQGKLLADSFDSN